MTYDGQFSTPEAAPPTSHSPSPPLTLLQLFSEHIEHAPAGPSAWMFFLPHPSGLTCHLLSVAFPDIPPTPILIPVSFFS